MEALPVSVYGIGVRDMGYVFFFQWAGMGEAYTRSLAVVFLTVTLCYSLIGGLLYAGRIFAAGRRARDELFFPDCTARSNVCLSNSLDRKSVV